ncbi:hypothetical protein ACFPFV_07445 [Salinicoccus siamensis]|uniref:ComK protein n=1 Tax=Salinicoccus siamensis TaxID=381830 RepID=A0ABV5Z270_9STAP
MSNNWFEVVMEDNNTMEQGDIIKEVSVLEPTIELIQGKSKDIGTIEHEKVIILTQSCDLANTKTPWIHVSPVVSLSEMQRQFSHLRDNNALESIRRGNQPKFHMINECILENYESEKAIIDFRNVFTLPYSFMKQKAEEQQGRLRLQSPYKEHLSQAYARFFMRVGLPNDIPKFE